MICAAFPDIPNPVPLDAVHASNVLHFLTGPQMQRASYWMFDALKCGGKVFLQTASPYCGHFEAFLPEYQRRLTSGTRWPGEIMSARSYASPAVRHLLPDFVHHLGADIAQALFEEAGFRVEYCDYYRRPGLPQVCWMDGRENLGLIAVKP